MEKEADQPVLKAPYPYPGGKARVADLVWERLGDVGNYVEPFAGSLAVLLRRPADHFRGGYRVETVNDANHFIVNFWRAVTAAPDDVARWADWPVMEADLHARHRWLMRSEAAADFREKMRTDPAHYDAQVAGWWVWGVCCWFGSGWCDDKDSSHSARVPAPVVRARSNCGVLMLSDEGRIGDRRPVVNAGFAVAGTCDARREWLTAWMRRLADRLRLVRTCYGDWSRVCDSNSALTRLDTTGVFLDPPYPLKTTKGTREAGLYANDKSQDLDALRDDVLAWCRKWGQTPAVRIAVCGYEGDGYEALEREGWDVTAWEASGGYGGKAENAKRERIWWSPACGTPIKMKRADQAGLFPSSAFKSRRFS